MKCQGYFLKIFSGDEVALHILEYPLLPPHFRRYLMDGIYPNSSWEALELLYLYLLKTN